jgi:acetyltransferase-like isoleucine patch superfamily enzyme
MTSETASEPVLANPSGARSFADDPFSMVARILTKLRTIWMGLTYPFARFGHRVSIHYSADIRRSGSNRISIGDRVYIARDTWLNIPEPAIEAEPAIVLENGCRIGRRCMISAKNRVHLGADVMLGPSVAITDHSHEFSDPELPIHAQGLTAGGTVSIEQNCWLGHGAAVICTSGNLSVGRNSVIGANAVVTRSVPPFSVVVGSPAKIVRRFDTDSGKWLKTEINSDVMRSS